MKEQINNSTLSSINRIFIEELYERYLANPESIDESWRDFFHDFQDPFENVAKLNQGASWKKTTNIENSNISSIKDPRTTKEDTISRAESLALRAAWLVSDYRQKAHLLADIDPLGLQSRPTERDIELNIENFGFSQEDLNTKVEISNIMPGCAPITLAELISTLRHVYANKVAIECEHVATDEERYWLYSKIENEATFGQLAKDEKKQLLEVLTHTKGFEDFLHIKFPGTKRFSVEGGESLIAAMEFVVETAATFGVEYIVFGMAHRGRLSSLTRVLGKPYVAMLSEFQGNLTYPKDMLIMGDVKYHSGHSSDKQTRSGNKVHVTMVPNPSHLETVNPVVAGKVRAEQDLMNDSSRSKAMGLLIHGDSAFAGQGVVPESLVQSELDSYTTGGLIHIIINNQVGFTTDPYKVRKSRYPSENAKALKMPIFHINGDDPEAVIRYTKLAVEYRQKFRKDVLLDITCYRLYGHNEGDEPQFTQPTMYRKIAEHTPVDELYARRLIDEGVISEEEYKNIKSSFRSFLDNELIQVGSHKPKADWLEGHWQGFESEHKDHKVEITGIPLATLKSLGLKLAETPPDFKVHNKIARQLEARKKLIETGKNIDWGTGEALAFASLLIEGYKVRLSGQDAGRGTFSHRHSVLIDQDTEEEYIPLQYLAEHQGHYEVTDSNLSEYAALGFEYGYSLAYPKALTVWEAQFGDFANGAQIIIDQYISSAQTKWLRMSGIVMLLPHAMEGQGPEHSSARLERFLQLSADNNMQVVNCTTPANIFHVLRRQLHRNFRKPLIVMAPKSLLRHRLAVSELADMGEGTHFQMVIGDNTIKNDSKVTRAVVCSGKVYYDLYEERQKNAIDDVALIRLEQFYPFPHGELARELQRYKNAEIVWCQEEHKNMGAYNFLVLRMHELLKEIKAKNQMPIYVGRPEAASPACGYKKVHDLEQQRLVEEAIGKKGEVLSATA